MDPPSVSYHDWIDAVWETPEVLCVRDILDMDPGTTLDLACFDRNMWDSSLDREVNQKGVATRPSEFLREGYRLRWTKIDQLKGTGVFSAGDWTDEPREFEFEVEYCAWHWYPTVAGCFPPEAPVEVRGRHISELPDFRSLHVGWRGMVARIEDLDRLPYIVWTD